MDELRHHCPVRLYEYEARNDRDGCVRVIVPRFPGNRFGRLLARLFVQREDKINLDELGSFVYTHCDGSMTVESIGAALRSRFGDGVEPMEPRLTQFVRDLFRRGLISFKR